MDDEKKINGIEYQHQFIDILTGVFHPCRVVKKENNTVWVMPACPYSGPVENDGTVKVSELDVVPF